MYMPDFNNADDWTPALDRLGAADRRAVTAAVADGRLSGWNPSSQALERLAAFVAGEVPFDVYRSWVIRGSVTP